MNNSATMSINMAKIKNNKLLKLSFLNICFYVFYISACINDWCKVRAALGCRVCVCECVPVT